MALYYGGSGVSQKIQSNVSILDDYISIGNKPSINGVELIGNKSLSELDIAVASTTYTKEEVDNIVSSKTDISYVNEQDNLIKESVTSNVNTLTSAINKKADKSDTYTKAEVDAKVSSVYKYKGSVSSQSALPTTNLVIGDVYNITDTGANFAYNGTEWDKLSETIDLTPYATKADLNLKADKTALPTKVSQLTNDKNYLTSVPSEYITESELSAKGYLTKHQDISGKANTSLNNLTTAGNTVIDNRINSIVNAKFQVVSALPSNPDSNTFYFITE